MDPRNAGSAPAGAQRRLLVGTGGAFVTTVLGTALALGAHFVLARVMGADAYGVYGLAASWLTILVLFTTVGFDTSLVRFLSEARVRADWRALRGVLSCARNVAVVGGVVTALLFAGVLLALGGRLRAEVQGAFLLAAALLLPLALTGVAQGALRGLKHGVAGLVPNSIVRPLVLLAVGGLLWLRGASLDERGAVLLHGGAVLVALVVAGGLLRRALRRLPPDAREAPPAFETRRWLRTSAPLFFVSGMRVLLNQIDIVLVGALLGARAAGIYGIASRLARLMSFGLVAGNVIAGPLIAELSTAGNRVGLERVTRLSARVSAASSLGIGVALLLAREPLLGLFGEAFREGAAALAILAAGQFVNALTGPVGQLLNMTGHQDVNARIFGAITLANAVLNVPAIHFLGLEGAALVTSALVALKNLWTWEAARRLTGVNAFVFGARGAMGEPS